MKNKESRIKSTAISNPVFPSPLWGGQGRGSPRTGADIERGYIALMAAIVISLILLALTFTVSISGYFSRFNALASENKRVSLGLAESCVNTALLKLAKNYNYDLTTDPAYDAGSGTVPVTVGGESCAIRAVTSGGGNPKPVTIKTQAQFRDSWSNMQVVTMVRNPTVSPPPQCADGVDNDSNGLTDFSGGDPGCSSASDNNESSPVCADTVVMLDRTGSISSSDRAQEAASTKALLDLYDPLVPNPKVGVGRFGNGTDDGGLAPAGISFSGQLNTNYSGLYSTVDTYMTSSGGYTNLGSAIDVVADEFAARGSTHADGSRYQHVLILISDGIANRPGSGSGANPTAMDAALLAADTAKYDPLAMSRTHIFAIHYGDSSGRNFLASLASGTVPNPGHQPGSASDKLTAAEENSDGDFFFIAPTATDLKALFQQIGAIVCPAAAGGALSTGQSMSLGSWEELPVAP